MHRYSRHHCRPGLERRTRHSFNICPTSVLRPKCASRLFAFDFIRPWHFRYLWQYQTWWWLLGWRVVMVVHPHKASTQQRRVPFINKQPRFSKEKHQTLFAKTRYIHQRDLSYILRCTDQLSPAGNWQTVSTWLMGIDAARLSLFTSQQCCRRLTS